MVNNYTLSEYKLFKDSSCSRMLLNESKDFFSPKEIEEKTYWKGVDTFYILEKIKLNEIQSSPRRGSRANTRTGSK